MIYLLVAQIVAIWLFWRWSSLKTRERRLGAETGAMGREQAEGELARIRAALGDHITGRAPMDPRAAEALAERGAWIMDRIRGMEGRQTGPAPRIRAKMELMEAAAQMRAPSQDTGLGR